MGKGGSERTTTNQTSTQGLDPASQAYVDKMRVAAQNAANTAQNTTYNTGPTSMTIGQQADQFMNPYMQSVIDPARAAYERMRQGASNDAGAAATAAGAFGGNRHGIVEGQRLGEIDAAEGQFVGGLLNSGWQNAMQQGTQYTEMQRQQSEAQGQNGVIGAQNAMGMYNMGMGPVGSTSTNKGFTDSQTKQGWGTTAAGLVSMALPFVIPGAKGAMGAPTAAQTQAMNGALKPTPINPNYRPMR